jgi:hypothetical protein
VFADVTLQSFVAIAADQAEQIADYAVRREPGLTAVACRCSTSRQANCLQKIVRLLVDFTLSLMKGLAAKSNIKTFHKIYVL